MFTVLRNVFIILLVLNFIAYPGAYIVYADSPTSTPTPAPTSSDNSQDYQNLINKINQYQNQISQDQSQENTLSSQITVMNDQIQLLEYRIAATKQELTDLTGEIGVANTRMNNLDKSLTGATKVLINRIVATYEQGSVSPIPILFASNDVQSLLTRESYLQIVQEHDKELLYNTQAAKDDYQTQKDIFQTEQQQALALNAQLQTYNSQLNQEKQDKQNLLTETQGDEQNYQNLLSNAEAQLSGFQNFTTINGGASLLSNQTVCDSWGCYYNQRDSQWGDIAIDNSQYSIAEDGCLMTSMAMVLTHYGHHVTPLDINANPDNFASYAPAYLKYTITAGGVTATRVSAQIDSVLNDSNHDPVIVGISYDGGPLADHFVVLVSGSNGNYIMNDPYVPNGHMIPFTDHYSIGSIVEIDQVEIN